MNYTYLLRCRDGSLYCGWTNNPEKRLAAHNAGTASKYTASRRPVELVYLEEWETKQEAMKREAAIKKMNHREKLKMIGEYAMADEMKKENEEYDRQWELKPVNFSFDQMFAFVQEKARSMNMPQTMAMLSLLQSAHGAQKRRSIYGFETTYMVHPLTMACHALAMGLEEDDILAACLAHDMVEDSGMELADLPAGERVREAVGLVSKNLCNRNEADWEDKYYRNILGNPLACLVKCLDRIHNVAGMADAFSRNWMARYTAETDRYYPEILDAIGKVPEWSNAWWLLRYQLTTMTETFKRLL
jgi:GTP pyrophosphokinase